ncbi:MAG: gliding motility-associated C-terminal domain-containing protein [Bacteroidota bacterium]
MEPNVYNSNFKIFKGDANALATGQGVFNYPATISGLTTQTLCIPGNAYPVCDGQKACILPGTYTMVNYGNQNSIDITNQMQVRLNIVNTTHYNLATAEDMGDLLSIIPPAGGSVTSDPDYFSCKDNAIVIDGFQPCKEGYGIITSTKAIYRQFYLSSPASVSISSQPLICGYVPLTLFRGKATDGLAALTVMPSPWRCFDNISLSTCDQLPAGWYTVVSYGWGASYENPTRDVNSLNGGYIHYGGSIGYGNRIQITVIVPPCPKPKYNRPYKAAIDTITHQPFLIQWAPRAVHTAAYPKTDTTYTLYTENFNCTNDTPFASHPLVSCYPGATKVAYWVFRITQESFVSIITENYWNGAPYAYSAKVYAGNARTDSVLFGTAQPIQPCLLSLGHLQLCKLQPGDYTLVLFATPDAVCKSVTPKIYIDQVGYSRFDHANNAYDFGQIRPDSSWYNGKPTDINPLNPGRAASNDFFYCTTGAQTTDPTYGCASVVLPNIYNQGNNIPLFTSNYINPNDGYTYPLAPARNLWYTFTVDKGGVVKVRVNNKTIGKGWQYPYYVLKSNVDGSLPFNTIVALGGVDSTMAQGLELVANNDIGYCDGVTEVSFSRETCTPIPERYYIVVANRVPSNRHNHDFFNPEWMYPNHQVEVSVLFDSINAVLPKFNHYYQANNIGTNLGPGTYTGTTDNFSCATSDATDPIPNGNCTKNLWYKFSTTVSGNIRFRMYNVTGGYYEIGPSRFQLFRQIIPGDSTVNGLQYIQGMGLNDGINGYYFTECITPGTYYIILPNCGETGGEEYPEITLTENAGDFCSRPVIATLNGAGTSITSALINCHTIGTDYGEFNPTLTCPAGAITNQYKTSWFRINITGTDTLDVTTYLSANTNASSSQIKYRLMNGNCGAMQERSCVQDALTQDTYKCLAPGDYWIQVFSPANTTGTIDLHLNAVHHADTCAPLNPCLSNANFQKQFDCTQSTGVRFVNYSTYGSSVSYLWNFGYNGQTSTAVSPQFVYPSLSTSQAYYITLTVTNNSCGGQSTYNDSITIPARPVVNLGADISLCNGGTVLLDATSYAGATYLWNTNAVSPTITASATGQVNYIVTVTYNSCIARDTIRVNIDPLSPLTQYKYICGTDAMLLNAAKGLNESHHWSTGATTSSINVFNPGIYWDDISLNGCTTRDSFIVATAAYPLGNDRQDCFGSQPIVLNATTQGAAGYIWQNGTTGATFNATTAGLYWVDISFGSCNMRDTIVLSNLQPLLNSASASICQGQAYLLPSGNTVNATGVYSDTVRSVRGCDSLINTVNLLVQATASANLNAAICPGQTYTLPWGTVVNTSGVYRDTLRYTTGCDSIRRTVVLTVETPLTVITHPTICAGQTYTLPWGAIVNTPGIYMDTLHSVAGCDSVRRTVNLTILTATDTMISPFICTGASYTLPWGVIVNATGVYRDTLRSDFGCDSIRRTVNLTVQTPALVTATPVICAGQTYTLPWGTIVSATGTYWDTLRYTTGCDSLRRVIDLTVQAPTFVTTNPLICAGQSYTLPWGTVVSTAGVYRDTLRYTTGCDSIRRTVSLATLTATDETVNPVICEGTNYTLPWGTIVNTSGVYSDTLYSVFGCDSIRRMVNLTVQTASSVITSPVICEGTSYTLAWGTVVSTAGVYKDTLYYTTGCDSIRRTVNLTVETPVAITINPTICAGEIYILPSGAVVSIPGVYRDTLHSVFGCDSIRRTVNLTILAVTDETINPVICEGENYTLPWGTIVNTTGIYRDTLYSVFGCDSLRRIVNLTMQIPASITINPVICAGQNYTLPWGTLVNTAGIYRDTLHYMTGCDSLQRIVNLTVQTPLSATVNATICAGQNYMLPSGVIVNTAGVYRDTLYYTTGCDSLRRTVNLAVQSPLSTTINVTICVGQNYTLPSGIVVNTTGIYSDTLHYTTGCDSVRRTVTLTVQTPAVVTTNAFICTGQTYTLPWGTVVNTTGAYRDTLRYTTGCDSMRRIVNLTVQIPLSTTVNATICAGQNYTLPSGIIVNTAGVYRDTLHYPTGCDSLRRTVNLIVQGPTAITISAIICAGQTYTLPWGAIVNATGIYRDTLHYTTGCDSIRRTVNLTVQSAALITIDATICQGATYILPWGLAVNSAGNYRDTLHYTTGCDSVRRTVNLHVTAAAISGINAVICSDETYTLPWGLIISSAGIYRDTARTAAGCDSLIRTVNLAVDPAPSVSVSKSNDVNCILGIADLQASGGVRYTWTPATSLNNPTIYNPVASPSATTWYRVVVTSDKGCTTEDSVQVKVIAGDIANSYLVPNAFTPNGDGKNDCFGIRSWGVVTHLRLQVYNRWGEIVFSTTDPSKCWDGTYKGVQQPVGIFIYQVWAETICGKVNRNGTITLIR